MKSHKSKRFTAVITREKKWYVARCMELGVTSQGKTLEAAKANLQEAVELYIESFGARNVPESGEEILLYRLKVA